MEHKFHDLNLKGRMRSNVQSQTWLYVSQKENKPGYIN